MKLFSFIFFLNFEKWNFLAPTLKIFPEKNLLYFFLKKPTLNKILYILKNRFSYILGNGTFLPQAWETSYISGGNILSLENKKNPILKTFLIFQGGTCKAQKTNKKFALKKFLQILQKKFFSHFRMTADQPVK